MLGFEEVRMYWFSYFVYFFRRWQDILFCNFWRSFGWSECIWLL